MSFTRLYRVRVWFDIVTCALLIAVVLCWFDRCFDSCVLLGLLSLSRVTQEQCPELASRRMSALNFNFCCICNGCTGVCWSSYVKWACTVMLGLLSHC